MNFRKGLLETLECCSPQGNWLFE